MVEWYGNTLPEPWLLDMPCSGTHYTSRVKLKESVYGRNNANAGSKWRRRLDLISWLFKMDAECSEM